MGWGEDSLLLSTALLSDTASHTCPRMLTYAYRYTQVLSHACSYTDICSFTHAHTLTDAHTHTGSFTRAHTPTPTRTLTHAHPHARTNLPHSCPQTHTQLLSLSPLPHCLCGWVGGEPHPGGGPQAQPHSCSDRRRRPGCTLASRPLASPAGICSVVCASSPPPPPLPPGPLSCSWGHWARMGPPSIPLRILRVPRPRGTRGPGCCCATMRQFPHQTWPRVLLLRRHDAPLHPVTHGVPGAQIWPPPPVCLLLLLLLLRRCTGSPTPTPECK